MFTTDSHGIWTVVHPVGELDLAVEAEFRDSMLQTLHRTDVNFIALDLSEVTFLDSTAISVMVMSLREQQRQGGRLVLTGVSERISRTLKIVGVDKILEVCDGLGDDEAFAVDWIVEAS